MDIGPLPNPARARPTWWLRNKDTSAHHLSVATHELRGRSSAYKEHMTTSHPTHFICDTVGGNQNVKKQRQTPSLKWGVFWTGIVRVMEDPFGEKAMAPSNVRSGMLTKP